MFLLSQPFFLFQNICSPISQCLFFAGVSLNAARPYRAFGHPWTTGAAAVGSVLFLAGVIAADTRNTLYGCGVLIASYPIYRLGRRAVSPIRDN